MNKYVEESDTDTKKMNTAEIVIRQILIINKLRRSDSTFEELRHYLQTESEILCFDFDISQRTFQREIKSIATAFDIEIIYDRSLKKYRIICDDLDHRRNRMIEALDLFKALSLNERLSDKLLFQKRVMSGSEYLSSIIKAIESRRLIQFSYKKFYDNSASIRTIEPYALKEYKNRWYAVGLDTVKNEIRIFGLDRISNLEELKKQNNKEL